MKNLINSSIEFLQTELQDKGLVFAGFSGGKDSIVTADLLKKANIKHQLYYSVTGIDPPEIVKFIRREYPECIFLKPSKTFWHSLLTKNPPAKHSRWCCMELKKKPGLKINIQHRVMGIRAEEGSARAKYQRIEYFKKYEHFHYHPILDWSEGDIWEYIDDNKLSYPALYDEGLSRIGCVICPYHYTGNGRGHDFYRKRWPKMFTRFEQYCKKWFDKRKKQGRKMFFKTSEEFTENWYRGNVQWYERDLIDRQMSFADFNI